MRRPHFQIRRNKRSPKNVPVTAFGLRVGYWPCIRAPFIQLGLLYWQFEAWFGLPSYQPIDVA